MIELYSKKHFLNFYVSIIIQTLLPISIGVFIISLFIDESKKSNSDPKSFIWLLFGPILIGVGIYIFYEYLKKIKSISLSKDTLTFGSSVYSIKDISKVKIVSTAFLFNMKETNRNATEISLKSKEKVIIYDFAYSNTPQLKTFIYSNYIRQEEGFEDIDTAKNKTDYFEDETYETYKGNSLTSFDGIAFWMFFLFFFWVIMHPSDDSGVKFYLVTSFIWLIIAYEFANRMHYYKLSKTHLIIKNSYMFWINDKIRLTDIFQTTYKKSLQKTSKYRNYPNRL